MGRVAHIVCPFPPCTGEWWVGLDNSQTAVRVPLHMPEGDFELRDSYELRCPGALTTFSTMTEVPALITQDVEAMHRAYEHYLIRLAQHREQQERERDAASGKAGPYLGGPIGRPVDPNRPREDYFPGRPADAPEPGRDEQPAAPVPSGVEGHQLGRDAVDDSHAATVGLTRLALEQHGRAQEALSIVTDLLDRATAAAAAAETHIRSANALVVGAVGTGAGKPAPGEAMAEQTALAVDTLSGPDGGNLHNAINVAKIRAEMAHQQIVAAVSNGRAYIGLLGG